MFSGGSPKHRTLKTVLVEEADEEVAVRVFTNRMGQNPFRVACDCCGQNYSVLDGELEEFASWSRRTVDELLADPSVLVIRAADIKPSDRLSGDEGEV